MIARLKGTIEGIGEDWALVDVHGVGYLVYASRRTLQAMRMGEEETLLVEMHVREDHIHLFGFVDNQEKQWFTTLITVQGIGTRMALSLLSLYSPEELGRAVMSEDRKALTAADGIGPKLASRVVTELKDKVSRIGDTPVGDALAATHVPRAAERIPPADVRAHPRQDAVSALENLGYGRSEAFSAVGRAAERLGESAEIPALIREALKEFDSTGSGA